MSKLAILTLIGEEILINKNPLLVMHFLLNKGTISWSSKKQACITLSTMKDEFITYSTVVNEVIYIRRFFTNLEFQSDSKRAITIYCDNKAIIAFTKDPKY